MVDSPRSTSQNISSNPSPCPGISITEEVLIAGTQDPQKPFIMAHDGPLLRLALAVSVFAIVGCGSQFRRRDDPLRTGHPLSPLFHMLNLIFKRAGWAITFAVWALLLVTRYNRQICLRENASWRRHAVVDAVLMVLFGLYWYGMVGFVFPAVANNFGDCLDKPGPSVTRTICVDQLGGKWRPLDISGHVFLASMCIFVLAEEIIRAVSAPAAHFTFPTHMVDQKVQTARVAWTAAISCALVVIIAWKILLVRSSLWFHAMDENIMGVAMGSIFWLLELAIRLIFR